MSPEPLLDSTYRLLFATNLNYRQLAEGTGLDKNWIEKFKQRVISKGAGIDKVQRLHDFLFAYEAIRVPQGPTQVAGAADPSLSQSLGAHGNG